MRAVALPSLLFVSACAAVPAGPPPPLAVTRSPPMLPTGLDRVLGQTAYGLKSLFGEANQDVREGQGARRLQFSGPICILDAYLYPPKGNESGEGVVTYVDARQPDGSGFSGSLYNPNDGKTYSGSLKLTGPNTLEVAGCVMSVFCKRQTWTRVK